jgi:hypothetical protein
MGKTPCIRLVSSLSGKGRLTQGRIRKINLQKVACFSSRAQSGFIDHIYHASHHNFTIKTPQQTHAFFPTPIKKRP